jgi:hypothetical protein
MAQKKIASAPASGFKFALGAGVMIANGQAGTIVGRAEYDRSANQYQVQIGKGVARWVDEDLIAL